MESSKDAIKREIKEELDWNLNYILIAVFKNILNTLNYHSYEFIYKTIYNGKILNDSFNGIEGDFQIYKWVKLEELDNYNLKPNSLNKIILNIDNSKLIHSIEIIEEKK